MTRYRIVCVGGETHAETFEVRKWAEEEVGYCDALFDCGPHRVEEVDEP